MADDSKKTPEKDGAGAVRMLALADFDAPAYGLPDVKKGARFTASAEAAEELSSVHKVARRDPESGAESR